MAIIYFNKPLPNMQLCMHVYIANACLCWNQLDCGQSTCKHIHMSSMWSDYKS